MNMSSMARIMPESKGKDPSLRDTSVTSALGAAEYSLMESKGGKRFREKVYSLVSQSPSIFWKHSSLSEEYLPGCT